MSAGVGVGYGNRKTRFSRLGSLITRAHPVYHDATLVEHRSSFFIDKILVPEVIREVFTHHQPEPILILDRS